MRRSEVVPGSLTVTAGGPGCCTLLLYSRARVGTATRQALAAARIVPAVLLPLRPPLVAMSNPCWVGVSERGLDPRSGAAGLWVLWVSSLVSGAGYENEVPSVVRWDG